MHKAVKVEALKNYKIHVTFDDGVAGEVDLSSRLFGPVFEPLKDEKLFRQVAIDEFGVVTWPATQADLAPDALYKSLLT